MKTINDPNSSFASRKLVDLVLDQYSVGALSGNPIPLQGDTTDINYKVTTNRGLSYFLKCPKENRDTRFYEFLGGVHKSLIAMGIPVPKIYKNNSNKYMTNGYLLFEFMRGETKKTWTLGEANSVVANLAVLHNGLEKIRTPLFIQNRRDVYIKCEDMMYGRQNIFPKISASNIDEAVKGEILKTLELLDKNLNNYECPKHLIHGDLGPGNALFQGRKLTAIIDLTLRYDSFIYDLGVFIFWTCIMADARKHINFKMFKSLMSSYLSIRDLKAIEKEMLPYFILRRSCARFFYCWQRSMEENSMTIEEVNKKMEKIATWNKEIHDNLPRILQLL